MGIFKRSISAFMVAVFVMFICGNTMFVHSHLEKGYTIVHSHPHLPSDGHKHISGAYVLIAHYNAFISLMICSDTIEVGGVYKFLVAIIEQLSQVGKLSDNIYLIRGRALPVTS